MSERNSTPFLPLFLSVAMLVVFSWSILNAILHEDIAYAIEVPKSYLTTDEVLENNKTNRKTIEKVEFLDIKGSEKSALSDSDLESVMENPEFLKQVKELEDKGATLPPLHVLAGLFVMGALGLGGAMGQTHVKLGSRLSDFFKFERVPRIVEKTVKFVTKEKFYVPHTVNYIKEKVIHIPRKVAYTATKVVKEVSHKTRTIVNFVTRHKGMHPVDRMKAKVDFVRKYAEYGGRNFRRNLRYSLAGYRNEDLANMKKGYEVYNTWYKKSRRAQRFRRQMSNNNRSVDFIVGRLFDEMKYTNPAMYAKLKAEFDRTVYPTYTKKIVRKVVEPVVKMVKKTYTAYRTVYDKVVKRTPATRTYHTVETRDVEHERVVRETVYDTKVTPLRTKMALALNYVKNLPRIHRSPSNRSFKDALKLTTRTSPIRGLVKPLRNLNAYVNNTRKGYAPDHAESKKAVLKYNDFVRRMKEFAFKVRDSKNPMETMFGRLYTEDIVGGENGILAYEARIDNLRRLKQELNAQWPTNGSKVHYFRMKSERFSKDIRQASQGLRRTKKRLKDSKADYKRRFCELLDQIDRLAYLKDIDSFGHILSKTAITNPKVSYVLPSMTVTGLRPVFTGHKSKSATAVKAAPKKILPKQTFQKASTDYVAIAGISLGIETHSATPMVDMKPPGPAIAAITTEGIKGYLGPGEAYGDPTVHLKSENAIVTGRLKDNSWIQLKLNNGSTVWVQPKEGQIKFNKNFEYVPEIPESEFPEVPEPVLSPEEFTKKTGIPYAIAQYGKLPSLGKATEDRLLKEARAEAKSKLGYRFTLLLSKSKLAKLDGLAEQIYVKKRLASQTEIAAIKAGTGLAFGDLSSVPKNKKNHRLPDEKLHQLRKHGL